MKQIYSSCFGAEKTEAQAGEGACPRSQGPISGIGTGLKDLAFWTITLNFSERAVIYDILHKALQH